ncbi:MAG: hypothetical protein HY077_18680 [Elusimicrobia bacterium]|nr:hypothetical protein [Elusimicrobiota bacterium]
MKRTIAAFLSSALILLSPGLLPYQALAADFNAPAGGERISLRLPVSPVRTGTDLKVGELRTRTELRVETDLPAGAEIPTVAPILPEAARLDIAAGLAGMDVTSSRPQAKPGEALAVLNAAARGERTTAARIAAAAAGVTQIIQKGDVPHAEAGASKQTSDEVQDLLSGSRVVPVSGVEAVAPESEFGDAGSGVSFGKPAGWDSIRPDAERYQGSANTPVPPSRGSNDGGGSSSDGGKKVPLVPRIISAVTALVPAVLLGWPLLAGGSLVAGALVILASLSVAALPFMSDSTPKLVRSVPGILIGALGLRTLAALGGGFAWPVAVMGTLAALGGWGFVRFARKGGDGKAYRDANETIATFFGALAAVAGAGLVLAHPAGWIAAGLTWVSYAGSAVLLMQLPSWVGAAIRAVFYGALKTVKDSIMVMTAISRDTSLFSRLKRYTEAAVEKDSWNALWLGLLVWLPVVAIEAARYALGAAVGLLQAAGRAPLNLLWGASHELAARRARRVFDEVYRDNGGAAGKDSYDKAMAASKKSLDGAVIAKFFAGWAGFAYHNSKGNFFNPIEADFLPLANSESKVIPGSAFVGVLEGFENAAKPYDEKKDDPDSAGPAKDQTPAAPEVTKPEVKTTAPGKIMAVAIALVPAYFLGLPLLATISVLGALAAAAIFSVAFMPLTPKASWYPKLLRVAPGSFLFLAGALTAAGSAYFGLYGLPVGWLAATGLVSLLSGIGLRSLISKLRNPATKSWKINDGWYIGGFASALFVTASLGAALLNLHGVVFASAKIAGLVASPVLLYHLPESFWAGVGLAVSGVLNAVRKVHQVTGAWHRETKFESNLGGWYKYWVNKSFWYAPAFIVPLALQGIAHVVEAAVSLGLGLSLGALRAPTMWLWGMAHKKNPNGRIARFLAGLNRASYELMEGSKESIFDKRTAELKKAMDEKDSVTSRPTLKAAGSFVLLRLMQAAWLIPLLAIVSFPLGFVLPAAWLAAGGWWLAGLRGLGLILGLAYAGGSLFEGVRNAWGQKKPPEKGQADPDDPKGVVGSFRLFGWRW